MSRAAEVLAAIRRKPDYQPTANKGAAGSAVTPIVLAGSVPTNYIDIDKNSKDGELGTPNGRTGNDYPYPGGVRGRFDVDTVNGDRLQDMTSRHLHEGPGPGRIPHGWNDRNIGILGRDITGNPSGDRAFASTSSGQSGEGGGIGDMKYIPHTPTPRNIGIARTYLRTVDDAAFIPGVYVSDPTRH